MTKARKRALATFFEYCYRQGRDLDDPKLKNDDDVPRALMGIRAAARVGYYDVTGEWLSDDATPGTQQREPREPSPKEGG